MPGITDRLGGPETKYYSRPVCVCMSVLVLAWDLRFFVRDLGFLRLAFDERLGCPKCLYIRVNSFPR